MSRDQVSWGHEWITQADKKKTPIIEWGTANENNLSVHISHGVKSIGQEEQLDAWSDRGTCKRSILYFYVSLKALLLNSACPVLSYYTLAEGVLPY